MGGYGNALGATIRIRNDKVEKNPSFTRHYLFNTDINYLGSKWTRNQRRGNRVYG